MFHSHCAECHGPNGEGGIGPNLTTGVFYHGGDDADLFQNIANGIEGTAMPSTFFDAAQVWQIVAYVRSLAQSPSGSAPPGDPHRGDQLFRQKGCGGCHLVQGEGGLRGPDLTAIGSERSADYLRESIVDPDAKVLPEYWVAKVALNGGPTYSGFVMNEDTYQVQLMDFSKGLVCLPRSEFRSYELEKKSIMPSYKDQLNRQELDDLVSYLWSLKRKASSP